MYSVHLYACVLCIEYSVSLCIVYTQSSIVIVYVYALLYVCTVYCVYKSMQCINVLCISIPMLYHTVYPLYILTIYHIYTYVYVGVTIMALRKHPNETAENKRLLKELIEKWSRPIFNKSGTV